MAHDRQPTELDHAAQITPLNREWDHAAGIDMPRLRDYRLGRTRAQLTNADVAGALLFDPSNMRYASGYRSGPLFQMHLPLRYLFVATDGPIVLFGERTIDLDTISETRPSIHTHYMLAGPELDVPRGPTKSPISLPPMAAATGAWRSTAVSRACSRRWRPAASRCATHRNGWNGRASSSRPKKSSA